MKPYYEDDLITLYHADCLEHLDLLDQADVMVTDPPYGMDYTGFGGRKGEPRRTTGRLSIRGDTSPAIRDAVLDSWGDRPAIVFGKWTIPRPENTRARLIWDKTPCGFIGDVNIPWGHTDEEIYVTGAWPPLVPGGLAREGGTPARSTNILRHPTMNSQARDRPDHPTPKPVPLMEDLICKCPPGVIVDPFAGSGATLRAAKNLGRRAIGFEIEEKYCEIIAQRLAQEVLFT